MKMASFQCLYPRPAGEHSPVPAGHPGLGRTGEETEKVGRIPSPRDFSVLSLAALVAQGPGRASHHAGSPRVSMMAPGDGVRILQSSHTRAALGAA